MELYEPQQSEAFDKEPAEIYLPPLRRKSRALRPRVMIVAPSLPKSDNPEQCVVTAVVSRLIIAIAEAMSARRIGPRQMPRVDGAKEDTPNDKAKAHLQTFRVRIAGNQREGIS